MESYYATCSFVLTLSKIASYSLANGAGSHITNGFDYSLLKPLELLQLGVSRSKIRRLHFDPFSLAAGKGLAL